MNAGRYLGVAVIALLAGCVKAGAGTGGGGEGDGSGSGIDAAGGSSVSGVQNDALVSTLLDSQVMAVCKRLDDLLGLQHDLPTACHVEAYVMGETPSQCDDSVAQCQNANMTMLGFEEPSNCAFAGRVLPDCKIMVSEALGCAQKLGAFWKDRTCSREALEQAMPACSSDLAARCPSLFGGANSGGSGGGDGTNGSGAHCQGAPDSCFSQFDQVSCHAAQGCTWSSDANMCSGLPTPCASYADAGACARQSGCSWVP